MTNADFTITQRAADGKRKIFLSAPELADLFVARHGSEWRFLPTQKNWHRHHKPRGWHHLEGGQWIKDFALLNDVRCFCREFSTDGRYATWAAIERILRHDLAGDAKTIEMAA